MQLAPPAYRPTFPGSFSPLSRLLLIPNLCNNDVGLLVWHNTTSYDNKNAACLLANRWRSQTFSQLDPSSRDAAAAVVGIATLPVPRGYLMAVLPVVQRVSQLDSQEKEQEAPVAIRRISPPVHFH